MSSANGAGDGMPGTGRTVSRPSAGFGGVSAGLQAPRGQGAGDYVGTEDPRLCPSGRETAWRLVTADTEVGPYAPWIRA